MIVGHWQVVILGIIALIIFGPVVLRIVRRMLGQLAGEAPEEPPRRRPRRKQSERHAHCPHCGAENPDRARFCCDCGKPMDYIEV